MSKETTIAWRKANPERVRAMSRRSKAKVKAQNPVAWRELERERAERWRAKNRDRIKMLNRRAGLRRYGLTLEQYDALLVFQNHTCALCARPPEESLFGKLYVDHDHKTGIVRGLLCYRCNAAIAQFGDDLAGAWKVVAYMAKHSVRGEVA